MSADRLSWPLVTRLREGRTNGTALCWTPTRIHGEAADAIERLTAELEAVKRERDHWSAAYDKAMEIEEGSDADWLLEARDFLQRNARMCMTPEGSAIKTLFMESDLSRFDGVASRIRTLETLRETAERERDAARDALKPFAAFAKYVAEHHPGWNHDQFRLKAAFVDELHELTMKPFRRARTVTEGGADGN